MERKRLEGDEWKFEVRAINRAGACPIERDRAFNSLRSRVLGVYYKIGKQYGRVVWEEGEEVAVLLDEVLWQCARRCQECYESFSFFKYFWDAAHNRIKMILRHRFLRRKNLTTVPLLPSMVGLKGVVHDIIEEVMERLSPIQKRVFIGRLAGMSKREIGEELYLETHQVKPILKQIRKATRAVTTEV